MGRLPRTAVLVVLLVAGLSGCGASTPTCDEATGLIETGRLDQAAEGYALARERGEGDCAETGLDHAGNRFQDAYVDVARARLAEERGEVDAAVAAYRAALVADTTNPVATEALTRLQQPAPQLREPPPPVPEPPVLAPLPAPVIGLIVAIAVLLGVLVGLLAWATARWRRWVVTRSREYEVARAHVTTEVRAIDDTLSRMQEHAGDAGSRSDELIVGRIDALRDAERTTTRSLAAITASINTVRQELTETRTLLDGVPDRHARELERQLDELADVLSAVVDDGGPTLHRYRATGDRP